MARRRTPRSRTSLAATVAVALLALVAARLGVDLDGLLTGTPGPAATSAPSLSRLFEEQRSGVVVEGEGSVVAVLRDDLHGSRHQRFILETEPGFTILVSHNIDLAPRVDHLERGDAVAFRGQYEWNEKGGVVHWTHHDPDGRRPGGWLSHAGRTYR